jgi:hypothetical protein
MQFAGKIVAAFLLIFLPASAAAQNVYYTIPYFDLGPETHTNIVIKETRDGERILSAEIDICYQLELEGRWDRAVIALKADGARVAGQGKSQLANTPIEIDLIKRRTERAHAYSGKIRIAGKTTDVAYDYVTDHSEPNNYDPANYIVLEENPENFAKVSPQWIAVRFRRGGVNAVLNALRGEPVVLQPQNGLVQDCFALRSNQQILQFTLAPAKAAGIVAKLRKVEGVLAVGWSGFSYQDYATRLPVAAWSKDGKLDRARIAAAVEKSLARQLNAAPASSKWDEKTGEWVLTLKRTSQRYRDAGFTETVQTRLLIEPERPGATDYFVVWLQPLTVTVSDEGPGPRLEIALFHEIGGEGIYIEQAPIAAAIAKDLGGRTWDSLLEKWN